MGRRNFHPLKCARPWARCSVSVLSCSRTYQAYSRCLMRVSLLPAPSLSFLGQEQACGLLCPIWPLASLKAVNVPWGPLCLTRLAWAGPPAGREGGRRKVEGHLASAGLQNISGNRWEGLNVGALQNILLSLHQQMLICQYKRAGSGQVDVGSHLAFATC